MILLRSEASVASDHRPFLDAFGFAAAIGALLSAALGTVLARGVARPVARVAAASRRLAAGEHPSPLTERGSDELRTLTRSFNEMADQLGRARAAEQSFLISISHELKTPLTAIRGYAEGLADGLLPGRRAGNVIQAEAQRLERLVSDLLELARLKRIGFDVEHVTVDLGAIARDAAERHAARARELGVELAWWANGDPAAVADHDRVLQAVSNLVENALRCTPAGGVVGIRAASGRSPSPTPARASPPKTSLARSSASSSTGAMARTAPLAPASGWRSCASSSARWAATSSWRAGSATARCSGSGSGSLGRRPSKSGLLDAPLRPKPPRADGCFRPGQF